MILTDSLKLRANVLIELIEVKTGKVVKSVKAHNLVTSLGLEAIGKRLALLMPPGTDEFAVGIGTTAAALSDTALGSEIYREKVATAMPETSGAAFQYLLSAAVADGEELTEAGIFDVDGNLMARVVHADDPINKVAGYAVNYTWHFVFGNAT